MAQGWARRLAPDWLAVDSAGIEADGKNARAIAVMEEAGADISGQESSRLTEGPELAAAPGVNATRPWYERLDGVMPQEICCAVDARLRPAH